MNLQISGHLKQAEASIRLGEEAVQKLDVASTAVMTGAVLVSTVVLCCTKAIIWAIKDVDG